MLSCFGRLAVPSDLCRTLSTNLLIPTRRPLANCAILGVRSRARTPTCSPSANGLSADGRHRTYVHQTRTGLLETGDRGSAQYIVRRRRRNGLPVPSRPVRSGPTGRMSDGQDASHTVTWICLEAFRGTTYTVDAVVGDWKPLGVWTPSRTASGWAKRALPNQLLRRPWV